MPAAAQEHRPRYINERNSKAEAEISAAVSTLFNFHVEKLSDWAYRLDYCAVERPGWHQNVLGYMEIKDRPRLEVGRNSGYLIAAHKVAFARILTEGTTMFAWAVVRAGNGAIIKTDLRASGTRVILSGRRDRGTVGDIEPMHVIPWSAWTYLDGSPVDAL